MNLKIEILCLLGSSDYLAILARFLPKVPLALLKQVICRLISSWSLSLGIMRSMQSINPSLTSPVKALAS